MLDSHESNGSSDDEHDDAQCKADVPGNSNCELMNQQNPGLFDNFEHESNPDTEPEAFEAKEIDIKSDVCIITSESEFVQQIRLSQASLTTAQPDSLSNSISNSEQELVPYPGATHLLKIPNDVPSGSKIQILEGYVDPFQNFHTMQVWRTTFQDW
ncbi:hypothetical protein Nepgr_011410 [Nepenthes gracilis]|uniref:Uncharacterized protein n=1 Tax=Nepenthes gracilis TaxID=150966 RepID=A0AAD3XMA8_NEPGR|nr:hypothetical protein Nepgr_011410 [Nepenthes gracilis]